MSKSQPGPWWPSSPTSGPAQRRLLLLVLALGLTVILMREARQPERWRWLWAGSGRRPVAATDHPGVASASPGRPPAGLLPPAGATPADAAPARSALAGSADTSSEQAGSSAASTRPAGRLLPGIDRRALDAIDDNTVFRPAERAAWFNLFDVLKAQDARQLQRESMGEVSFVQLFEQPDQYRGRLVTVRGQVRRVLYRPALKNDLGIRGYYQVVVRPADGPNSPLIIYCLDLPKGFPTGDGIHEDVTLYGLFFKNWAFATRDDIRSFPTLVAKTLNWVPPTPVAVVPVRASQLVTLVIATAIVGVCIAIWIVRRGNRLAVAHARRPAAGTTLAEGEAAASEVAAGLQRLAGGESIGGGDRVV